MTRLEEKEAHGVLVCGKIQWVLPNFFCCRGLKQRIVTPWHFFVFVELLLSAWKCNHTVAGIFIFSKITLQSVHPSGQDLCAQDQFLFQDGTETYPGNVLSRTYPCARCENSQ